MSVQNLLTSEKKYNKCKQVHYCIFKLRQGASIRANVGRSVGRSVRGKKFRGKFVESRNQIFLIIFDYLINFWHCWGDRVATKINSKAN